MKINLSYPNLDRTQRLKYKKDLIQNKQELLKNISVKN